MSRTGRNSAEDEENDPSKLSSLIPWAVSKTTNVILKYWILDCVHSKKTLLASYATNISYSQPGVYMAACELCGAKYVGRGELKTETQIKQHRKINR